MNKIYYLWVDECDWDEYDSFVVIAKKRSRALAVVKEEFSFIMDNWQGKIHVQFLGYSHLNEQLVIGSYNAG